MHGSRIVSGLAVVFGGMALLFAVLAVAYNLVFFVVAGMFGLAAAFVWYHASGRMARRLYRGVENRAQTGSGTTGGFGGGPQVDWEPPRDGTSERVGAGRQRATAGASGRSGGGANRGGRSRPGATGQTLSEREAYDALGLDPGADEGTVSDAYRRKVKQVHPDTDGGDEERFKEVQAAYERLTEE
ncbi:molecular chaperone DnaJ [Halobacteriales archaeon QH_10_67_22]|nr:MAG: molecular chaperone DnaJ [Halobacteriales archaeon QH_10_67_22]